MLVVFLLLLIFFVNFTLANPQLVRLDVLGMILPEVTASTLVLIPFVVGGSLGLLVSLIFVIRLRLANQSLRRKLARRDNDLDKLKNNTLKGLTDA